MADVNLERLAEVADRLAAALGNSADEFDEYGKLLDDSEKFERRRLAAIEAGEQKRKAAEEKSRAAIEARIKAENEATEKQIENMKKLVQGMTSFAGSLTAAPGSFGPLKGAIDITTGAISKVAGSFGMLGKVIGGAISAFGEVGKFIVDQFEKSYATFEKLAESGVINTFEDLTQSGQTLGLTFADAEKVLSKSGKELASLGGSAVQGRKEFEKIALASEGARRDFQKLGIGAADFSEFQLSYVAQQQRYSRGQKQSAEELARGSQQYIVELDALSKLTGVSRKQLQAEQEARMRDSRYRAGIASMDKAQRDEINNLLSVMKQVDPAMEEGMKDLIASGGLASTEAAKQLMVALNQGGMNIQDVVEGLRSGSIKGVQAFKMIGEASGKAADSIRPLQKVVGDQTMVTKLGVALEETRIKAANMTEDQYQQNIEAAKKTKDAQEGQNKELAETKQKLYESGRNIELLATSSDIATKAMNLMASGLEYLTEKMYEMAGKELPEHLKARREERKANDAYLDALKKAENKIITTTNELTGEQETISISKEEQVAAYKRDLEQATKKRIEADRKAGVGPAPTAGGAATAASAAGGGAGGAAPVGGGAAPGGGGAAPGGGGAVSVGAAGATGAAPGGGVTTVGGAPASAQKILDFIGQHESRGDYDILVGNKKQVGGQPVKITEMTVGEVLDLQRKMRKPEFESTAVGKYQIIRDTLMGNLRGAGVSLTDKFDKTTQDKLGVALLRGRGFDRYTSGIIDANTFADNLSKEWASLPYNTGKSYYQGVGSNKSLIERKDFVEILKAQNGAVVQPKPGGSLVQVAEAGQAEAVVPMPDGRTIPVTITNSSEQIDAMRSIFGVMATKLDAVIDLLSKGNRTQANMLANMS